MSKLTDKRKGVARKRKSIVSLLFAALMVAAFLVTGLVTKAPAVGADNAVRNVIFFHPDGYGLSHWNALRLWLVGPDGRLNWDKLPHIAPYTEHMTNALTASSHGGATVHAYGVKVVSDSFGLDGHNVITALSGKQMSIMEEAIEAGFATALLGSGCITEPGTAVFVASAEGRGMNDEINEQVIESGVDVILAGGERYLLPEGVSGRHGTGGRADGLNLIERAKELGYTIVYTRDELMEVAGTATKVLGVFASGHTFNSLPEEVLRAKGWPHYRLLAPTMAEMSAAALEILSRNPKAAERGIFIVAEEEGTDNFGNVSNASGSFEAGKRADEAFGVFVDFVENNPNTLLITAGDSGAGAKSVIGPCPAVLEHHLVDGKVPKFPVNTDSDGKWVVVPLDGADGAATVPFLSAPDAAGQRHGFAVGWVRADVSGSILARAKGLNAELVTKLGIVDNTDIYRIMYYTLFGKWLGEPLKRIPEIIPALPPPPEVERCFIATAAYGTPLAQEVEVLKRLRDEHLFSHPLGRTLVSTYERISPPVAELIRRKPILRKGVRIILRPLLWMSRKITE